MDDGDFGIFIDELAAVGYRWDMGRAGCFHAVFRAAIGAFHAYPLGDDNIATGYPFEVETKSLKYSIELLAFCAHCQPPRCCMLR